MMCGDGVCHGCVRGMDRDCSGTLKEAECIGRGKMLTEPARF